MQPVDSNPRIAALARAIDEVRREPRSPDAYGRLFESIDAAFPECDPAVGSPVQRRGFLHATDGRRAALPEYLLIRNVEIFRTTASVIDLRDIERRSTLPRYDVTRKWFGGVISGRTVDIRYLGDRPTIRDGFGYLRERDSLLADFDPFAHPLLDG